MIFKDETNRHLSQAVKSLIHEVTSTYEADANAMLISDSTLKGYVNDPKRDFPLFLAVTHPRGEELARWLCSQLDLRAVPAEVDPSRLNGEVDDELLIIYEDLGMALNTLRKSRDPQSVRSARRKFYHAIELLFQAIAELDNV